jgi:hypothetical protein
MARGAIIEQGSAIEPHQRWHKVRFFVTGGSERYAIASRLGHLCTIHLSYFTHGMMPWPALKLMPLPQYWKKFPGSTRNVTLLNPSVRVPESGAVDWLVHTWQPFVIA